MTIVTICTETALAAPTATTTTNSPATQSIHAPTMTGGRKANTGAKNKAVGVAVTQNTIDVSSGVVYTIPIEGSRKRKRHSKRHSNFNIETLKDMPWVNPCGGFYVPSATQGGNAMRRKNPKKIFNLLKRLTENEYKTLKAGQQDIDISNIQIWSLHNKTYKFLPKLKINSTIALKRWYRNMQSFVGSFAYLRSIQRAWDMAKLQRENSTARELKRLFISARNMLCELETAINGTMPAPRMLRGSALPQVTSQQMNKRLKLHTKRRAESNPNVLQKADTIDLMWVKYYYYEFLKTMWKVLRQQTKRRGQIALNAENPKAFNEVEKHFGSIAATKRNEMSKNKRTKDQLTTSKSEAAEALVTARSSSGANKRKNANFGSRRRLAQAHSETR
uniref:1-phosphatidylinositol 3-phosphate 5-kinase FAB1 n=2 Tax=Zeugodacus cucurbitae TaxID=28588 RepID=A0A0A1XR91_ZEUCU